MTGGLLLLALVGVLDTLTGPELSFSLFYLASGWSAGSVEDAVGSCWPGPPL